MYKEWLWKHFHNWSAMKNSANESSQDPIKIQILIQEVWGGTWEPAL